MSGYCSLLVGLLATASAVTLEPNTDAGLSIRKTIAVPPDARPHRSHRTAIPKDLDVGLMRREDGKPADKADLEAVLAALEGEAHKRGLLKNQVPENGPASVMQDESLEVTRETPPVEGVGLMPTSASGEVDSGIAATEGTGREEIHMRPEAETKPQATSQPTGTAPQETKLVSRSAEQTAEQCCTPCPSLANEGSRGAILLEKGETGSKVRHNRSGSDPIETPGLMPADVSGEVPASPAVSEGPASSEDLDTSEAAQDDVPETAAWGKKFVNMEADNQIAHQGAGCRHCDCSQGASAEPATKVGTTQLKKTEEKEKEKVATTTPRPYGWTPDEEEPEAHPKATNGTYPSWFFSGKPPSGHELKFEYQSSVHRDGFEPDNFVPHSEFFGPFRIDYHDHTIHLSNWNLKLASTGAAEGRKSWPGSEKTAVGRGNLVVGHGHHYKNATESMILGQGNRVDGRWSLVAGKNNMVTGSSGFVIGGERNEAVSTAVVSGGTHNRADAPDSVVSGGHHNTADAKLAVISSGKDGLANGTLGSINAGSKQEVQGMYGVINGGENNFIQKANVTRAIIGGKNINHPKLNIAPVADDDDDDEGDEEEGVPTGPVM